MLWINVLLLLCYLPHLALLIATLSMELKSECSEKSKIERQILKMLKLWLLVVHIELFIAVWFICEMVFCFGRK